MDGLVLVLFALAAFAGGFVSGFSGFAMGLVVSGVWLHIITPVQTAALIAGYGLLTQGYGILKLRQALNWQKIWPLTLGTTIGIPIGVILLRYINPVYLRFGVGVLLVLYTIYGLVRPAFKPMKIGVAADIGIGVTNGLVGGLTGLGGIVSTISCQWRGWTRDVQRAVFQPVLFAAFVVISISMGITGAFTTETLKLYGVGLPFMARRHLERIQALRKNRRRDIPQGGVGASFALRPVVDRAGVDLARLLIWVLRECFRRTSFRLLGMCRLPIRRSSSKLCATLDVRGDCAWTKPGPVFFSPFLRLFSAQQIARPAP